MEGLRIKEARNLLDIRTRYTINRSLKALDLFGRPKLTWEEFRLVLEMQVFLGLKHGRNSRAQFCEMTEGDRITTFKKHGIDIEKRFTAIRDNFRSSPGNASE